MEKFFKPGAKKELVYLKAPGSCSQAPAPSKKEVKASTNGTSSSLAGRLKPSGGESSPSSEEAKASALAEVTNVTTETPEAKAKQQALLGVLRQGVLEVIGDLQQETVFWCLHNQRPF